MVQIEDDLPINTVEAIARSYFDDKASALLGSGWQRITDTIKGTVLLIGILAAALYFYEHSKWHKPSFEVVNE